jgi:hypothetical protein
MYFRMWQHAFLSCRPHEKKHTQFFTASCKVGALRLGSAWPLEVALSQLVGEIRGETHPTCGSVARAAAGVTLEREQGELGADFTALGRVIPEPLRGQLIH